MWLKQARSDDALWRHELQVAGSKPQPLMIVVVRFVHEREMGVRLVDGEVDGKQVQVLMADRNVPELEIVPEMMLALCQPVIEIGRNVYLSSRFYRI